MKIAVGNSRMDKKWKNQDVSWADLCARCGSTIRTTETVEEYRKLKKGQQDGIKVVAVLSEGISGKVAAKTAWCCAALCSRWIWTTAPRISGMKLRCSTISSGWRLFHPINTRRCHPAFVCSFR